MNKKLTALTLAISLAALGGCQLNQKTQIDSVPTYTEQQIQAAISTSNQLIKDYSQWELDSSPMLQSYRGLKTNYDQWNDLSDEYYEKQHKQIQAFLAQGQAIDLQALPKDLALSLEVLLYDLKQSLEFYEYKYLNYPINQMFGLHSQVPTFLINIHQIETIDDAHAYIKRVERVHSLFKQLIVQLKNREAIGVLPPSFVFDSVIAASEQQLKGYPLDKSKVHHVVWADFVQKIEKLDLYESSKKVLKFKLKRAITRHYKRGYKKLVNHLKQSKSKASKNTGFHQFSGGMSYYNLKLQATTTTDMSAEEIHQLGLNEIARIKQEITQLLPLLNQPSVEALFHYTRTNKQDLYYLDGKQAMDDTKQYIQSINKALPLAFKGIPNMPMEVKAVEHFREASSPVAFYQPPSDDGKRPGRYYMNLSKLNEMPKFQFEALAYHETLPGHHLQSIYALSSESIPEFRRHSSFTAYSEGWGLYAEFLGKELGGYQTAWNEYGRLLMELWRANRLVIDTGLHYFGWNIEKALEFRLTNTPFTEKDSLNAIQRYLVMPGQATAYKVGQIKIMEFRENAETRLGKQFDLGAFHKFILDLGPLPLSLLEREVNRWIRDQEV
jgi:uncharacterized protein (DUF885 family)